MKPDHPHMLVLRKVFDEFRKSYPGKRKGIEREWINFVLRQTKPAKHQGELQGIPFDAHIVTPLLSKALEYQKLARAWEKDNGIFVPSWKGLSRWVNANCWDEEHPEYDEHMKTAKPTVTNELTETEADKFF